MPIETPKELQQATIEGGAWVVVKYLDGKEEKLFLRVPLRRFWEYVDNRENFALQVAIAAGQPAEWTDKLRDDSIIELAAIVTRITDPRVSSWIEALGQEKMRMREREEAMSTSPESPPAS